MTARFTQPFRFQVKPSGEVLESGGWMDLDLPENEWVRPFVAKGYIAVRASVTDPRITSVVQRDDATILCAHIIERRFRRQGTRWSQCRMPVNAPGDRCRHHRLAEAV